MTEKYTPSDIEKANTLEKGDFLKISGDGIFATLQGEGITAGEPAVFLRLHNCNLHCGLNGVGWRCDAFYTWDKNTSEYWRESTNKTAKEVVGGIYKAWQQSFKDRENPRLVITGGEPLIQRTNIIELVNKLPDWAIEIETNGTILPGRELDKCQINCSPKLSSSGNLLRARYRPDVLNTISRMPNSWFKFVVSQAKDIEEIEKIVASTDISYDRVLLMSEGTDADKLRASDERLIRVAAQLGCQITARHQIFWFGNKRAT